MFNQNIAIVVDGETTNYGLLSIVGSDSERGNADAPIGAPELFRISHQKSGKGDATVDRHLVRIDKSYIVEVGGMQTTQVASAYVVLITPHLGDGKSNVKDAFAQVASFLQGTESGATASNIDRVLNGEP